MFRVRWDACDFFFIVCVVCIKRFGMWFLDAIKCDASTEIVECVKTNHSKESSRTYLCLCRSKI